MMIDVGALMKPDLVGIVSSRKADDAQRLAIGIKFLLAGHAFTRRYQALLASHATISSRAACIIASIYHARH